MKLMMMAHGGAGRSMYEMRTQAVALSVIVSGKHIITPVFAPMFILFEWHLTKVSGYEGYPRPGPSTQPTQWAQAQGLPQFYDDEYHVDPVQDPGELLRCICYKFTVISTNGDV